jgi:hypothetical protein
MMPPAESWRLPKELTPSAGEHQPQPCWQPAGADSRGGGEKGGLTPADSRAGLRLRLRIVEVASLCLL